MPRLTLSAALAAVACAFVPSSAAASAEVLDVERIAPRMFELTIRSPALDGQTRARVIVPSDYGTRPRRRFPVVYLLHAALGNYKAYSNAGIAELTEGFPGIFVMPDGGRSGFYSDWFNGGAGGPPRWEGFHIGELLSLIDRRFRTIAARRGRAVLGGSMGGFGAMSYAARHPDLFSAAVSISGAVDTNFFIGASIVTAGPLVDLRPPESVFGPRLTQEVRWRGHNPVDLANNLRGLDLQILTHDGLPSARHPGFDGVEYAVHAMSESLHLRLAALGIGHTWTDYGSGGHTIEFARVALVDALARLERVLAAPPPRPQPFSHRSTEPRFSVWGWDFAADPQRALEFLEVDGASRSGLTLTGSGTETVTTPPYFRRWRRVEVSTGGEIEVVRPGPQGRVSFQVALGVPHPDQQYTFASRLAGENKPGYFDSRSITLTPRGQRPPRRPAGAARRGPRAASAASRASGRSGRG